MSDMKSQVMAIDGPSGSGKSTITKALAKKLNLTYLDTGAMFRGLAYFLNREEVLPSDDKGITKKLEELNFHYAKDKEKLIEINGEDLTEVIRDHNVSQLASLYSKNIIIRDYLKKIQRKIASERPSILEGRDIGTVIFPNAKYKFFITASDEVRALRRYKQLKSSNQLAELDQNKILADIVKRDSEDKNREVAPLRKAEDAIEIDTTNLEMEEVIDKICHIYTNQGEF